MESLGRAIELEEKAIALDESEAGAHADLGFYYAYIGQFEKAVAQAERALALDPNSFAVLHMSAAALAYSGKPEEAIWLFQKALRLNPFPPGISFYWLSLAYCMVGRFDEAVEQAKKAVERDPENQHIYLCLAFACIFAGREEEARAAAAEVLRINPAFSIEQYARLRPHVNKSQIDRMIDAWRKAGLK